MIVGKVPCKMSRRRWVASLSGLFIPAYHPIAPTPARAAQEERLAPGAVETVSVNQSARATSFEAVEGTITPVDQFFSRSHHDEPTLSMSDWSLRIEGSVRSNLTLTFADLLELPHQKLEAVLECAGNRGHLVSNGLWEGVSLPYLLSEAGLGSDAQQVLLEGVDTGSLIEGRPARPFTRLVSLEQCLRPDGLVAFKLNGQFLPPRNGFPARALFPGTYAMDAVKWLRRIVVLRADEKPESFYASGMNLLYRRWVRDGPDQRITAPVSKILTRSAIAFPSPGARLATGRYSVWGFAWTGQGTIAAVDVSTDDGVNWESAKLESPPKPFTWVRWSVDWQASNGEYELLARARDDAGNLQPLQKDPNRVDGYECNWSEPVRCSVR